MRILYLKAIVPQHKASLSTDYDKIKSIVNSQKQAEQLDNWFKDRVEKNYIKIDSAYDKCSNLL
jgi:peptidyl-prolyl cis-trans isomerase SurA